MAPDHFPRTNQLAAYRVAAHRTQEEVALGLCSLAFSLDGAGANVTDQMVSRWERGHRRPSKYYRRLLARYFDASEVELGLRLPPIPRYAGEHSSEVEVKRREFLYNLALLAGGITTLDLDRMAQAFDRPGPASDQLLDNLYQVVLGYARDAHTQAPAVLLPAVRGHLAAVERLLSVPQADSAGRWLRVIAGHGEALGGWLSYQLDSYSAAAHHYAVAESMATEAGDGQLRAHALTLRSWMYSSVSQRAPRESALTAITLLTQAVGRAGSTAHPHFRAWILARRAQQYASLHDVVATHHDLDEIDAILGGPRADPPEGFLAHWQPAARAASARGKSALFLQDADATLMLEQALARTPAKLESQRASIKNDIAAASIRAKDPDIDRACAFLAESLTDAGPIGIQSCIQHTRDVRRLLEPWREEPVVRRLDEQILTLAA